MRFLPPVLVLLVLSGCASFDSRVEPHANLAEVQFFWVERSLSDNHALGIKLTRALEARGRRAEHGPLTMMPPEADAVLSFRDQWTWDFRDHITALHVTVRHPRTRQLLARARFEGPLAMHLNEFEVIDRVVDELLGAEPAPPEAAPAAASEPARDGP